MNIDFEPSKLVNEVKTHLPDLTEVVFRRRAHDMGMNASELLRDLVCEFVHGAPYLDLVIEHRRGTRDRPLTATLPETNCQSAVLATGPYGVRK